MTTIEQRARKAADKETTAYIARRGYSRWQVANETAIENEVSAVWNEAYREAKWNDDDDSIVGWY